MLLENRNAIVYGGGGAVGGAVAKAFAREGARVFLAGRTRETLEAVAGWIREAGGRADVAPVDALDGDAVEAHLEDIAGAAVPVRIMFNAVGLEDSQGAPLTACDRETFLTPIVIAMGAVEHFIRHLAKENGQFGVRACCVRSPGSPDSPGVREVWAIHAAEQGLSLEDLERKMGEGVPLRRITPLAQIADIAVLLASDLAAGMTATVANGTGGAQID